MLGMVPPRRRNFTAPCLGLPVLALLVVGPTGSCSDDTSGLANKAEFVGSKTCAACHQAEHDKWRGSHHDLAMQEASEETVLGDFADWTFEHFGVESKLYKKDGRFFVRTDGVDGKLAEFEVHYTFGHHPLQQYLVALPKGRLQALGICWDSRPKEEGGQRWFHLYDEKIAHDDPLHWTGPNQNWNYMCANCHSTNLRKNYDVATDTYKTSWSEIDVSCEACHGPGSNHVTWADGGGKTNDENKGIASLGKPGNWIFADGATTAKRSPGANPQAEFETCARCHSRRSTVHEDDDPDARLLDNHLVSLLEEGLYHADGQIQDEVYVYGSFVQSKMYREGVTCSDCHDAHSLKPRAPGNALCVRCHRATKYDVASHHNHKPNSAGASCVACHMPEKKYMVVDPRRDHSIRIPRPDLTAKLGAPNGCSGCHADQPAQWAAEAIARWRGADYRPRPHFAEALHAGRSDPSHSVATLARLARLAADRTQPGIARGTALRLLRPFLDPTAEGAIQAGAVDPDPLVRLGAVQGMDGWPPEARRRLAAHLLEDPLRAVRALAGFALAEVPRNQWTPKQRTALEAAVGEYKAFQRLNADQPWAHTNLGMVHFRLGEVDAAQKAYEQALRLSPRWVQAYVNLADMYRAQGRDDLGEQTLRRGLQFVPESAPVHQALGFLLHRQQRNAAALRELERAASLRPDVADFAYTYAVALNSMGEFKKAVPVLEAAHRRHPMDRDLLFALATFHRDQKKYTIAIRWTQKLLALAPQNPSVRGLLQDLQQLQRGR